MRYLLDTNVVSEFVRREPEWRVLNFVDSLSEEAIYLSGITVAEISQGIARLPESKKRRHLSTWLEDKIY